MKQNYFFPKHYQYRVSNFIERIVSKMKHADEDARGQDIFIMYFMHFVQTTYENSETRHNFKYFCALFGLQKCASCTPLAETYST
jgi:hypothetical protein